MTALHRPKQNGDRMGRAAARGGSRKRPPGGHLFREGGSEGLGMPRTGCPLKAIQGLVTVSLKNIYLSSWPIGALNILVDTENS